LNLRRYNEENCMRAATSVDDMCYEERVLFRLLSGRGLHSSTFQLNLSRV